MTTVNSIVPQERLQAMNSLAMVLLAMTDYYDLPESVNCAIQDMQDEAETLCGFASMNEHNQTLKVIC